MRQERLRVENLSKEIYHMKILDHINMQLFSGEIVALLGANGAGKTVLMEALAGVVARDEGKFFYEEYPVDIQSPKDAKRLKIQYIPENGGYIDSLTVFDNLFFENDGEFLLHYNRRKKTARELLERVGVSLQLHYRYRRLEAGKKKLVKLAAALYTNPKILIMDEPFSFLDHKERSCLQDIFHQLKNQGVSILLTFHNIRWAKQIADRGMVLRDGMMAGIFEMSHISEEQIFSLIAGKLEQKSRPNDTLAGKRIRLQVKNLRGDGIKGASFCIHEGEILGIAGLSGSGRTRIMDLLFGLKKKEEGEICLNGKPIEIHSPEDALRHKIAYASNKAGQFGVIDILSVQDNVVLPSLQRISSLGVVHKRQANYMAQYYLQMLLAGGSASAAEIYGKLQNEDGIFTDRYLSRPVHELSLGFCQLVKLAQCLSETPEVLLLDHPTFGLDIEIREKIHSLIRTLSAQGMSILFVSDEIEEITALSHRFLILQNGTLTGEVEREEIEGIEPKPCQRFSELETGKMKQSELP